MLSLYFPSLPLTDWSDLHLPYHPRVVVLAYFPMTPHN